MREIKFRALDKPSSTMYQWEVVKRWGNIFDDNSKIVMQYTGLKDRNNQEIYESDVVEVETFNGKFKGIIRWEKTEFVISSKDGGYFHLSEWFEPTNSSFVRDIKVIGNIYENPELKEG